jgi:hypothetical protein
MTPRIPSGGGGCPGEITAAMMTPMTPRKKPRAKKPPALRFFFLAITEAQNPRTNGIATIRRTSQCHGVRCPAKRTLLVGVGDLSPAEVS